MLEDIEYDGCYVCEAVDVFLTLATLNGKFLWLCPGCAESAPLDCIIISVD